MNQPEQIKTKNQTCNCGCAECQSGSCQLDCAVQPRFFRGQVLNDSDLTQIITWTQSKLRLNRFRDGWGVVCGLEVACNCSSGTGVSVMVSPGYALDACGNDLVLCEEQCVDLTSVLPSSQPHCGPTKGKSNQNDTIKGKTFDFQLLGDHKDIYAVDLHAQYHEEGSSPQTVYGRDNCRSLSQCENSRITEGVHIALRLVTNDNDTEPAENWETSLDDYKKKFVELENLKVRHEKSDITYLSRASLESWLAKNHLHQFCFVSDWISQLSHQDIPINVDEQTALNWIGLDLLLASLMCKCESPESKKVDVPLARVWVKKDPRSKQYKVLLVDNGQPHRRLLSPNSEWLQPGEVDLRCYLWQPLEAVKANLKSLGFTTVDDENLGIESQQFLDYLRGVVPDDFKGAWNQAVRIETINIGSLGARVVGFKYKS